MKLKPMDISKERKALLAWMPHMIGLAFNLDHYEVTPEEAKRLFNAGNMIACTNGRAVFYGDRYRALPQAERNYGFLHELLHGTFCHAERIHLLHLQRGYIYMVLANWAADGIINEAINSDPATQNAVFTMPTGFNIILMSTIHGVIREAIDFSGAVPPATYDPEAKTGLQMETVYDWLVWAYEACRQKRQSEKAQAGNMAPPPNGGAQSKEQGAGKGPATTGQSTASPDCPEQSDRNTSGQDDTSVKTKIEQIVENEEEWDLIEADSDNAEQLSHSEMIAKANRAISDARGRIESVIQSIKVQGSGQGRMLLALEHDLPNPVIPWRTVIRRQLMRELTTKLQDSYTRPSSTARASIALGRPAPFTPGTTIFTTRPRILFVLDVSGSHVQQLKQCFAEVWSLARMKNASIDLVTFDDGVRQKIEIRNRRDFKKILDTGIQGGGGTALANLFDEVREMRQPYNAMIIMTDGYLTPPENVTNFHITWVVTPGGTTTGLKGTVVNMPDYMHTKAAA